MIAVKNRATARPVAYMLVRCMTDEKSQQPRMRTRLGCGIVNRETLSRITDNSKWKLGGIIGHFDNLEQAKAFVDLWRQGGGCEKAARGPLMRLSLGLALAVIVGLCCWIDFGKLMNSALQHYHVEINDDTIIARELNVPLQAL